jgi:cytochrome b pre-mRNA-processing protein 3
MLNNLFRFARAANREVTDRLYTAIVAAARRPEPYSAWQVPDTPLGRFEMLSLIMFLVQHRLLREKGAARELAQALTDMFFQDVDHSLRELGIGDMGIPKRVKKLARMYFGRATAYGGALDAGDYAALAAALQRNIRPDLADWPEARNLARYVEAMMAGLRAQETGAILAGTIMFAAPAAHVAAGAGA